MDVRDQHSANHPVMNLPPSLTTNRFGPSPPAHTSLPGMPGPQRGGHGPPPMGPPAGHGGPPPMMGPPPGMMNPFAAAGPETLEQFGMRITQTVTGGFLMLSMAMGHQTGLFDKLASFEGDPKTSQEIADETGLKERYVREWLGAMVTGRIVNATEDGKKFFLPPHRALFLNTPGLGLELLILASALPMQSKVFNQIRECFDKDGPRGVSYDNYQEFHHFMNRISLVFWERDLLKTFIPSIPGLTDMLESGASCLDVGCGEGGLSILLAQRFPKSSFRGLDIISAAINDAKTVAAAKHTENVTFDVMDAHEMPDDWEGRFNYIVCWDSLHDMAKVDVVLKKIHHVLAPGGIFSVLEVNAHSDCTKNMDNPFASTFYTNSLFHCMTVSMASEGGMGLGNMWGRENTTKTLESYGFKVEDCSVPDGWFNVHYLCRKK
ncbi:S-adenosylmethionine-dependent methyltransferase Rv2258c-like [Amphiura filiformis]|uniref:S-adenosylmethionine-dependent methyltransferase Rv2258c-like n=1 Tax=Amphiura filiformis TaxID=82378 RepID=UPI003B219E4D